MCANSRREPSESFLLASNLPRLSEDSKMLRAGTCKRGREGEREMRSFVKVGKKQKS